MVANAGNSLNPIRPPGRKIPFLVLLLLILLPIVWIGCSIEKNYGTLSFFFDGVPTPGGMQTGVDGQSGGAATVVYQFHDPYAADACLECHADPSNMALNRVDARVCLKCHHGVEDQYPVMHGALIARACLTCHNPHLSQFDHLLREQTPQVCLQCHTDPLLTCPSESDPLQATTDCLRCHSGHGGEGKYFLRNSRDSFAPQPPKSGVKRNGGV